MAKNLLEKSIALFELEWPIEEEIEAYKAIKEKVTKDLIEHQKNLQDKADETQGLIDRINGV